MPTIVKKGTNSSSFVLKSGKIVVLNPSPMLNVLDDATFAELMQEYGCFINERRISDKHPNGTYLIHDSSEYVKAQDKEIGKEITDKSAPIEVEQDVKAIKKAVKKVAKKATKAKAKK